VAATTISRATIPDGVTVASSAQVGTDIYDPIDSLLSSAITVGDLVHAEGFGEYTWSGGGTGGQIFILRNTTAGATNHAQFQLGNDAQDDVATFVATTTSFTTSNQHFQNGASLSGRTAGGLSIAAEHASGDLRLYGNGVTAGPALTIQGLVSRFEGPLRLNNIVSPAQITANVNDYAPSGLATANWLRLTSDASRNITGLDATGIADGQLLLITNVGDQNLVFIHESASSTAANRFQTPGDVDETFNDNHGAWFVYDGTTSRWFLTARI